MIRCSFGTTVLWVLLLSTPACAGDPPRQVPESAGEQTPQPADGTTAARARAQREQAARERLAPLPRVPAPPATEPGTPPPGALDGIKADASRRAGVALESVQILSSERAAWNDGALGCPVAGEFYTQMVTSGFRVLVTAGAETLDYRLADGGFFKLCTESLELPETSRADR